MSEGMPCPELVGTSKSNSVSGQSSLNMSKFRFKISLKYCLDL
jgi:hypothetical protein